MSETESRCIVDLPGQSCFLCRSKALTCQYVTDGRERRASAQAHSVRSIRPSSSPSSQPARGQVPDQLCSIHMSTALGSNDTLSRSQTTTTLSPYRGVAGASSQKVEVYDDNSHAIDEDHGNPLTRHILLEEEGLMESLHILGPNGAHDAKFVEQHLSPPTIKRPGSAKLRIYSNDSRHPAIYATVPKQHDITRYFNDAGVSQRKILEQILGPFKDHLLNLYIQKVHSAFPICDKEVLLALYKGSNGPKLSSHIDALVCGIYACSLTYWSFSEAIAGYPCPDSLFARSLAGSALEDNFCTPGLLTIYTSLVHLHGRPVVSVLDNSMKIGRTVALAHTLGLNRDPTIWQISQAKKNFRTNLWWGLFIHDAWASAACGIPPLITTSQHDVPRPTLTTLSISAKDAEISAIAEAFILLCTLAEILREALTMSYNLVAISHMELSKRRRRVEVSLDDWEASLNAWEETQKQNNNNYCVGVSSMKLQFLNLRMLIHRLALHEAEGSEKSEVAEMLQHHLRQCVYASQEIVNFMCNLTRSNFEEFWMPYTSSHLTVTATPLLRCAIQTDDRAREDECMANLLRLQKVLEEAKMQHGWDLGEVCVAYCKNYAARISSDSEERPAEITDEDNEAVSSLVGSNQGGYLMEQGLTFGNDTMDVEYWAHFDNGLGLYDGDMSGLSDEFLTSLL